ncbi:MAG: hypothetical protein U5N21_14455 [Rhodococcus sp. (in: high G+C Gram-positive bacteria)]|nr:hypothetical protein [Rhodococcus sp. (in: high G+C Gram-positive bacteria)]
MTTDAAVLTVVPTSTAISVSKPITAYSALPRANTHSIIASIGATGMPGESDCGAVAVRCSVVI